MSQDIPWVEKYRPQFLKDIVGNEELILRLQVIANEGQMPHLLVSGESGIGKTTSIQCLAKEILKDRYQEALLELNASDDRGMEVIRKKIRVFAQKKLTLSLHQHKIILLDEADSMIPGAQQAIRRIMERFSKTTRFALICNDSTKIIEPLASRCTTLPFMVLSKLAIQTRLQQVMKEEKIVHYEEEALKAILDLSQGDLRYGLNILQKVYIGFKSITYDNVYRVAVKPPAKWIAQILILCAQRKLHKAITLFGEIRKQGYASTDLLDAFFSVLVDLQSLTEKQKKLFAKQVGITQEIMGHGCNSALQFHALLARLCRLPS